MHAVQDVGDVLDLIDGLQRRLVELRRTVHRDLRGRELPQGTLDLLTCEIGDTPAALPLRSIEAVVMRCALTEVPQAPSWVAGMLDLHGEPVPALDLLSRLHGGSCEPRLSDVMIVCTDGTTRAALIVQAIGEVLRARTLDVGEHLDAIAHAPYVLGICRIDDGQRLVISVPQLLAALAMPDEENHP